MSNQNALWITLLAGIAIALVFVAGYFIFSGSQETVSVDTRPAVAATPGSSPSDRHKDPGEEEQDNWSRLLKTREAVQAAEKPLGGSLSPLDERMEHVHQWKLAQEQAKNVKPELLAKVHADLPDWCKRYQRLIQNCASANEVNVPLRENDVNERQQLAEWWDKNKADFHIPSGPSK